MVKNLIHQASAASDGSHTYSTVPSIDCNDGHLAGIICYVLEII